MAILKTALCDVLDIEHPIIQAGMGWDSRGSTTPPKLVAAVSNGGGLGSSAAARSSRSSYASASARPVS